MNKRWKERTVSKTKNGKIILMENVSAIFNDVNYYVLMDANGQFLDRDINYNTLHKRLYSM